MKTESLPAGRLKLVTAATLLIFVFGTAIVRADETKGATRLMQLNRTGVASAPSNSKSSCGAACCDSPKQSITTGTHLPTQSKKRLQITDTAQNLKVLDRQQLDRTGSANVADAVRKLVP